MTKACHVLWVFTYIHTGDGRYFFLNIEKDTAYGWAFHVEMLDSVSECAEYIVDLYVQRIYDKDAVGKHVYKGMGEPEDVELSKENKRRSGLILGNIVMDKKLLLEMEKS